MILAFFGPVQISLSGALLPFRVSRQPGWLTLVWGPLSIDVRRG